MPAFSTTPDILAAFAGAILSLLFSYIPGLSTKFAALLPEVKRLIMLGLLAVTSGVIFGLGCYGILDAGLSCDNQGVIQLAYIFITAVIANQATFGVSPQTNAVRMAKPVMLETSSDEQVVAISTPEPKI